MMQRKFLRVVPSLLTLVSACGLAGLVGCSDDDDGDACDDTVTVRKDEDADFGSYQTFAVAELPDISGLGGAGGDGGMNLPDDIESNLETANDAAVAQLKAKGLEEVDPDEETPDLWLFSVAATEQETGTYWQCVPGWDWWGYYWYWDPCAWLTPIPVEYTEGTLVVGVADGAEEMVVFGGVVQGILECTNESQIDDRITAAVDEIFEQFPTD